MGGMNDNDLSPYERLRLENIRRNQEEILAWHRRGKECAR